MSWMDSRWEIWDDQALTVAEESRSNGNMIDLEEDGVTDEQIAAGLWFNLVVGTAFATLTSGVNIAVINSDSATFASGVKCLGSLGSKAYPIGAAELVKGAGWSLAMPKSGLLKYLEVYWEPMNEAATAGKVDCWFGLNPIGNKKIQKNVT